MPFSESPSEAAKLEPALLRPCVHSASMADRAGPLSWALGIRAAGRTRSRLAQGGGRQSCVGRQVRCSANQESAV